MSNFLHKFKYKSALQAKRNVFSLPCNHITTSDFYQLTPVYCKEVIPNETIKIDLSTQTRCAPAVQPLFGSMRYVHRAFFVPMRTVMDGFNEFITCTPTTHSLSTTGLIDFVPRCTVKALTDIVRDNADEDPSAQAYDFDWNGKKWVLTPKGRLIFKIFTSLGYKLNLAVPKGEGDLISLLPLLSYAKIWCDWYANPQYDTRNEIESYFRHVQTPFTASEVSQIINACLKVCYSADYFTQSWDNPVSPNGHNNIEAVIDIKDNTTGKVTNSQPSSVNNNVYNNYDTPIIRGSNTSGTATANTTNISQYILNTLHAVTDFVIRHRMVGSRALDRYMAEYGIQLSSEKLNRSVYFGKSYSQFSIGDVMQTAPDTFGAESFPTGVGNYAGKILGSGNGHFEYTSDEFGYVIIMSYIEPMNNYVFGRPRSLFHLTKLDFFNGDFDNLGTQAVRQDEIICGNMHNDEDISAYTPSGIWGFMPRLSEYKVSFDNLSGDFLLDSKNASLEGYLLYRKTRPEDMERKSLNYFHDYANCVANGDDYASIWQDQTNYNDHFITIFRFDVQVIAPMKPLFDMYDYSNEDGKDIVGTVNGTQISD